MFDVLIYLGHSALCLAALYIIYKAAMSNETMHRLNRVVLLGIVALSALLPLCEIKIKEEVEVELVECNNFYLPDAQSISTAEMVVAEVEPFDYLGLLKSAAIGLFLLGVAFMLVRLVVSTLSVWRMIRSGRVEYLKDDVTLTVVDNLPSPFSYFGHIVVAESDLKENRDLILAHELAHVRLRHSWDVLFVDLALCVWWFNPAMWLLRRELQSLHEYQADKAVLDSGVDAKTYQLLLIKRAVGARLHSIANCLNHSNLKNRITMMCKKSSSRWAAAKLLLILPLVALSLAATATTVYVTVDNIDESKVKQNSQNNQTQSRIEERTFDTEVVKDDKFALSPAGSERYNLVPAEANVATQQSEKREIKGKVVDEQGKPISGVIVLVKNSPIGSITDSDGKFAGLKVTDEAVLAISHVGYESQQVAVKGKSSFTITLKTKIYSTETAAEVSSEPAVLKAEVMPKFMGGDLNKFRNWMLMHMKYLIVVVGQEQVNPGRVIAEFVVEKDGKVSFSKIIESPHELLSAEVEDAIRHSPNWTPGMNGGKPVRVKMHISVNCGIRNDGPVDNAKRGNDEDQPLMKAEILPSFQGGNLDTYRSWVESEVVYPKKLLRKKIGGIVTVEFIIDKDGSVIFSKIMQSPHELLSAEVERVIKSSPKWSPGKQLGEPVMVKMQMHMRVNYQVNEFLPTQVKGITKYGYDEPLEKAEKMPSFMGGGMDKFTAWAQSKLDFPKSARKAGIDKGKIIATFIVEKDGSVSSAGVMSILPNGKAFADEALRVIELSPKWEPGSNNGNPVRVKCSVTFKFAEYKRKLIAKVVNH